MTAINPFKVGVTYSLSLTGWCRWLDTFDMPLEGPCVVMTGAPAGITIMVRDVAQAERLWRVYQRRAKQVRNRWRRG